MRDHLTGSADVETCSPVRGNAGAWSRVRVEVSDQGGPWERSAEEDEQNGRGLLVVAQLARNFGRTGDDQAGWTVWFECG